MSGRDWRSRKHRTERGDLGVQLTPAFSCGRRSRPTAATRRLMLTTDVSLAESAQEADWGMRAEVCGVSVAEVEDCISEQCSAVGCSAALAGMERDLPAMPWYIGEPQED